MDSIIFFVKTSSNSLFKPVFIASERTRLGRWLIFLSASTSSSSSIILNKGSRSRAKNYLVKLVYILVIGKKIKIKRIKVTGAIAKGQVKHEAIHE